MVFPRPDASSPVAVTGLIAANLLPLAGVLWWGWSVLDVLVVYWLESGIIGALNVPKILLATREADGDAGSAFPVGGFSIDPGTASDFGAVGLASFFVMHYGVFWVVHGVFVFALPLFAFGSSFGAFGPVSDLSLPTIALAAGSMLVSHGVSFATNYLGRKEYRTVTPDEQMMEPYGRVMVLHVTIIVGAFLIASFGSPLSTLVLLVLLKTTLDLAAHLREHRKAAVRSATEQTA